ncbi:MAG: PAS domain S-box protein, partial [Clostridia bacterium]
MEDKKLKIVVIDKDPDSLASFILFVEKVIPGTEVFTASSGSRGIELAKEKEPDVIVMDIYMVEDYGAEVSKIIKKNNSLLMTPVLFITDMNTDRQLHIKAIKAGAEAFLIKPLDDIILATQLKAMVKIKERNKLISKKIENLEDAVHTRTLKLEEEIALRRESENRNRLFIDSSTDMIFLKDDKFRHIVANKKLTEFFDKSNDEVIGKTDFELMPKEVAEQCQKADIIAISTKAAYTSEETVGDRVFETTKFPVVLMNDKIGVGGFIRDITQRKRLEGEINRERDLVKMYFNTAGIMFVVIDRTGMITSINEKGCQILGLEEKDVIGKNWIDNFIPRSSVREITRVFKKIIKGETEAVNFFENPIITGSGEERLISWHNTILRDAAGNIIALLSAGNDITERKQAEDALKKSENKYSSYIENAPDGVFVSDENGKYIEVNKAASEITGYSKDELLEMNIKDMITEESKVTGKNHFRKLIETGLSRGEFQYKHKNGSTRWWSVDAVKLNEHRFLGFVKDITDRKKAEDELIYMSYHDMLTEVYNRRFFEEELSRLDTESSLPLSIIMGDINGLKLINDSFGHTAGDKFLKKTAEIIKKVCRASDIITRFGGDEFVVILPKTDTTQAMQIIKHIEDLASKEKVGRIQLSISFGYDTKKENEQKITDILANAENHMYRHKLYERSSTRSKTIDIIMNTLFEKSNRESLHSRRVSRICEVIASKMDLEKDDINQIRIAGLVHDIGKIGIDEKILNKEGSLSDNEWKEIKTHPEVGWRILSSIKEFSKLAQFILEHHERWDGKGYPNGLKGEEISLETRIISVADAYDAMTSNRSYRKQLSKKETVEEIRRCSGTYFDPEIAKIFIEKVLKEEWVITES